MIRPLALAAMLTLPAAPAVLAEAPPAAREVLPFIADDYGKALSVARSGKLPIFIEAWAPW